ncbi:MAG: hypothetical protein ACI8WB_003856 [Phenylobacterium sp.]|jgi:hypothetical protein
MTLDSARDKLATALLYKDANGHWPSFFSALRDYLGDAAERQLALLGEL